MALLWGHIPSGTVAYWIRCYRKRITLRGLWIPTESWESCTGVLLFSRTSLMIV